MAVINDAQVDKLLDDIASIKSVLADNRPLLKQLLLPIHFRTLTLLVGIAIVGMCGLYYYLLGRYGEYDQIPANIRTFALVLAIGVYVAMVILKRVLWLKSLKKMNRDITFGTLVKNIYSYQLLHVWSPIMVVMAIIISYLCWVDAERYIVTVAGVGMGIIYNSIGGVARIWQYLITGYWLLITGLSPLVFPNISALILLAISAGGGMLLFFLIGGGSHQIAEEE